MSLRHRRSGPTSKRLHFIPVSEPLNRVSGGRLRSEIAKHLQLQDGRRVHILDLRSLTALDSHTLATLIRLLRLVRVAGGSVGRIVDRSDFLGILSITALDRVFAVFRDENAALAALKMTDLIPA